MGMPSVDASNAIIYTTYCVFLAIGVYIAWLFRHQSKSEYLASNRTQSVVAIPLALNFIASVFRAEGFLDSETVCLLKGALQGDITGLGSGILFSYPQIATICGLQGVIIYAFSSSLPLLIFGWIGPIIREKCPEGFVLTEWTRQRYGIITAIYLSILTLITLFLYMVAELSALSQIITALTGLDGLPALIVEAAFTAIYTSLGGFRISFITDNIQGAMVVGLIILAVITVGVETHIDPDLVQSTGLLDASLLGWQLLYILPVAVLTNDFFISGFWMRTFASKTDRDLRIGTSIATVAVTIILLLVGVTGLLAAWTGAYPGDPPQDGSIAFFLLLGQLPNWVVGVVLCMTVTLSTAAYDSFVSAMVSTGSNDFFRNKLNIWIIRVVVLVVSIPVIIVALQAPSVLNIYLISDLLSASSVPVLVIGLSDRFYMWRGFEVVVGGLGGLLTVFIFGTIYYGNAAQGAGLLILQEGLYADDWSVFGAFVAAPIGGLLFAIAAFLCRIAVLWIWSRVKGVPFVALDKPAWLGDNGRVVEPEFYTGHTTHPGQSEIEPAAGEDYAEANSSRERVGDLSKSGIIENSNLKGKFF